MKNGAILILSGPSGCGKSSILKEIFQKIDNFYFSISTTTRKPREGEQNGVDYNFISEDEFKEDIENGEFLEWAKVHSNYYGTSLKPVNQALNEGKLVIFDIDVQGHKILMDKMSEYITSVFITTPNRTTLKDRLTKRATDSDEVIDKRLQNAMDEMLSIDKYDYIVINEDLDESIKSIESIINITKLKASLRDKKSLIKEWSK